MGSIPINSSSASDEDRVSTEKSLLLSDAFLLRIYTSKRSLHGNNRSNFTGGNKTS